MSPGPSTALRQYLYLVLGMPIPEYLVKIQHRLTQNGRGLGAVCLFRPLMRSMRDTIFRPCKHHGSWTPQLCHSRIVRGVCSCSDALITTSPTHAINSFLPERPWLEVQNTRMFNVETMRACNRFGFGQNLLTHAIQALQLLVHHAEHELGVRLDIATSHWPGLDVGRGSVATSRMSKPVQLNYKLARTN